MSWTSFSSSSQIQRPQHCSPCQRGRGTLQSNHRHICLPPSAVKDKVEVETEQETREGLAEADTSQHLDGSEQRAKRAKPYPRDRQPKPGVGPQTRIPKRRQKQDMPEAPLDTINPYAMGRKSRAFLEGAWKKFSNLSTGGRSRLETESMDGFDGQFSGSSVEFETPQAAVTNVLVIGATGGVGKVLVRKLLLRGYPVTVLVRPGSPGIPDLPDAVTVVEGDVGEYADLRRAMQGVSKVLYCAEARTVFAADLKRVCEDGVRVAAKALQDERMAAHQQGNKQKLKPVPFARKLLAGGHERDRHKADPQARWDPWEVLHCGLSREDAEKAERRSKKYTPRNLDNAGLRINHRNNLIFEGSLINRDAYATTGIELNLDKGGLKDTVALTVRVKGDGQMYGVSLTSESGETFMARFQTTGKFQNVRIPYNAFRRTGNQEEAAGVPGPPQGMQPESIRRLALVVENRTRRSRGPGYRAQGRGMDAIDALSQSSDTWFSLELNRIHALPRGVETDFVLVSCAGVPTAGSDPTVLGQQLEFKRKGEAALRHSGLNYTVVRPGPIISEPGGYKALVFDQGNRITQSISRADVADVCLKTLHDEQARNKTFEVCQEYTAADGSQKYELVAHLPDKANSYLTPALTNLESET